MTDERPGSRLAAMMRTLPPKTKQPVSANVLNNWIAQAERKLGDEAKGGRLGWLVASSVAIAAIQRAIDADGRQLFLLKGGTLLQHRLPATARTTKDIDGLVRGGLDEFIVALEAALAEPWGPLTLRRSQVEVVNVPTKIIKPRRFDVILELRGVTWRRVQFEVSPDEAGIGGAFETLEPPPLGGFGLPIPAHSSESPCGIRSRRNSTPSPIPTIHQNGSTTEPAMSSTCCSSAILRQPPVVLLSKTSEPRPAPSSKRVPSRPNRSDWSRGIGHRW